MRRALFLLATSFLSCGQTQAVLITWRRRGLIVALAVVALGTQALFNDPRGVLGKFKLELERQMTETAVSFISCSLASGSLIIGWR